jgi:hypothetical protein
MKGEEPSITYPRLATRPRSRTDVVGQLTEGR